MTCLKNLLSSPETNAKILSTRSCTGKRSTIDGLPHVTILTKIDETETLHHSMDICEPGGFGSTMLNMLLSITENIKKLKYTTLTFSINQLNKQLQDVWLRATSKSWLNKI